MIPTHDEPLRRSLARLVALVHPDCTCRWHFDALLALADTGQWEYLSKVRG